jgi:Arc/MetJ-type ribon-helix-helix transcriptional regulator
MGTTKVNFRLPNELVEKTDVAAEVSYKNRTEIIRDALQQYLQELEDDEAFQEVAAELYLDGEIGFETLKGIIGRQDAETVRSSKTVLEQDDDFMEL